MSRISRRPDAMLVFAHRPGDHFQADLFDGRANLLFGEHDFLGRNLQFGFLDVELDFALDLDKATFGLLQHHQVDHLRVVQAHFAGHFEGRFVGNFFRFRDDELHEYHAIASPFGFGANQAASAVGQSLFEAGIGRIGGVEFVDVDDFLRFAQGTAVDGSQGLVRPAGRCCGRNGHRPGPCNRVVALDERIRADAALAVAGDSVAVAFGVFGRVDEEAFLDCGKIAANLDDFLQKGNRTFLNVANHFTERA
jgi:hypothetical protein